MVGVSHGAALALALGYLLGSIPFGLILTRLAGAGDLRAIGSGNIGATNVLRTGRKGLAAATLRPRRAQGDVRPSSRGVALRPSEPALPAAAGAVLGHLYPVWLKFRGGKGVATFLGGLIGLAWPAAIAFAVVWLPVAYLTRYSSAAALAATRRLADRRLGDRPATMSASSSRSSPRSSGSSTAPTSAASSPGRNRRSGGPDRWRKSRRRRASPTISCSTGCG